MTTVSVNPLAERARTASRERDENHAAAQSAERRRLMSTWRMKATAAASRLLEVGMDVPVVAGEPEDSNYDGPLIPLVVEGIELRWSPRNPSDLLYRATCPRCGVERLTMVGTLADLGYILDRDVHPIACPTAPAAPRPEPARTRLETTLLDALVDFLAERGIGPEEGS